MGDLNYKEQSIDYRQIERLKEIALDDENFVHTMIAEFIIDTEQSIKDLKKAFEKNDYAQLYTISHTLKSTSKLFGANSLADTFDYLQKNSDKINDDDFFKKISLLSENFHTTKLQLNSYPGARTK